MRQGIAERGIEDVPIAVVDFETTGLTPGFDRVVEVAAVRRDPGQSPRVVLDTLVNPLGPVRGTEIHGITDADVVAAPTFRQIAGDLWEAVSGCVVSAYNVYFDMQFFTSELAALGIVCEPPHFCLMYMRPMLGLGKRCKLEEACQAHGISYQATHAAGLDARVSARLLEFYLSVLARRGVRTYSDLARLRNYKFTRSFAHAPLAGADAHGVPRGGRFLSRGGTAASRPKDELQGRVQEYWDALKTVLADLEITDEEVAYIVQERERLDLPKERIRLLHARAFASVVARFTHDQWLDDREAAQLRKLHRCLSRLGWAPGE